MSYRGKMKIGLALSGGGSRAIAFHLGCMKTLYKKGLLEKIDIISSVSGGSIIAALYVYSEDSFDVFENKIRNLLSKGLQRGIIAELLKFRFILIFLNFLIYVMHAILSTPIKSISVFILRFFKKKIPNWLNNFNCPLQRKFTRLGCFETYIDKNYFYGQSVNAKCKTNIVINACELRTGTAMRFGNMESGCWRFGKIEDNNVKISAAVTASAAFPVLLPSMDRTWKIRNRNGEVYKERLILTDGGVYDNLGVSCLEPGKSSEYSYNYYPSDYIICCNAGQGQFGVNYIPGWWASRMKKAFLTVFRKVQDSYADKLHNYKKNDQIKGFIYSYLGQQDKNLPHIPKNFVVREDVISYPTDFAGMKKEDMQKLITRGEKLTEILIDYYHSELNS